ncbi:hypothetical protein EYC80_010981 [Monilinia laxa]|uniref:N-alpha-acetyltransferase 40 n=1 Tax=Monilinia laxa TaxID=61186 RepID=A0A5N6JR74_MONLA|nr:hypothetical protein EYC80_010981 [Monilinia laxa]
MAIPNTNPIETACDKSLEDFERDYMPPRSSYAHYTAPSKTSDEPATSDGEGEGDDEGDDEGGNGEEKEEAIVEESEKEKGEIKGFMSFMPTFEDGIMVIYLYEIHLVDEVRGTGLGKHLMSIVTSVAHAIPGVKKTMLTCYTANETGLNFYRKLGYETDEFSPEPRRLKGGRVVENDYVILSKRVDRKDEGEGEERRIGDGKRKRCE